jgi:uncharacterized protein (DUF2267 family)
MANPKQEEEQMDELVNMVASKAGISQEQARQAVGVVIDFIKDRLPAPIAGQVDAVIQGGQGGLGGLGSILGKK